MARTEQKIKLNAKQQRFCNSPARYPAFVGSWGCGKRLDVNTPVKTALGWKTMGSIEAGDWVYGADGRLVQVLVAHPIKRVSEGYNVCFDSGEVIAADAGHLWLTITSKEKRHGLGSVKTTEQIARTIRSPNAYETFHRVPVAHALHGHFQVLPIEPYTLGAWLGDGHKHGSSITCHDDEVLACVETDGYEVHEYKSSKHTYYVSNGGNSHARKVGGGSFTLNGILDDLGVRLNKHVPLIYQDADYDQRLALLQGLMDTNGYCGIDGRCEYCSVQKRLADDVLELVCGLGIKARMYGGQATIKGRYISEKYRICFKTKVPVFRLQRKASRIEESTSAQMSRHTNRFIKACEPISGVYMRCLTVDSPDGLFLVGKTFIPTHNTMCGIIRGLLLSETFAGNLGLIVRKKFTDLRDSTLKDFERYTGLSVKKDAKEVRLSNGSVIMFRHGDELSGLQNVNLGWFMIEQAEEFETSEQFDLLRGRLRREESKVRQGMVIANTCGHNWIWERWKHTPGEGYELTEATIDDNREHLPVDTLSDWERLKVESPRKYNRYVLNSWEDYDIEGAFYAGLMSDALKQGRVDVPNLYQAGQKVYTAWDLGVSDTTAIVLFQIVKDKLHFIDCFEDYGQGCEHYCEWLEKRPYIYAEDYLPHDARNRLQGKTITTRLEIVQSLRRNPVYIVGDHLVQDGIETVRGLLNKCCFDVNCKPLANAMNHYKRQKVDTVSTEERPVFQNKPLHDWSSNYADAFRYACMAYRYMVRVDDMFVGFPAAVPAYADAEPQDDYQRIGLGGLGK